MFLPGGKHQFKNIVIKIRITINPQEPLSHDYLKVARVGADWLEERLMGFSRGAKSCPVGGLRGRLLEKTKKFSQWQ